MRLLGQLAWQRISASGKDLLPIVVVVAGFQIFVLNQPIPNLLEIVTGMVLVLLGMTLFMQGLETGLFPIGENMANAFARKGSVVWLMLFSFSLGFTTTIAEPALIAIAKEAAQIASDAHLLSPGTEARDAYATELRFTVAFSVGLAISVGVLRILLGWPIHYMIITGYVLVVLMTLIAPKEIIGIAYDSGGVTTSTVTVPLVTALGVGLSTTIRGRNPMIDGFGLIAFASLFPIIFVMGYGVFIF